MIKVESKKERKEKEEKLLKDLTEIFGGRFNCHREAIPLQVNDMTTHRSKISGRVFVLKIRSLF